MRYASTGHDGWKMRRVWLRAVLCFLFAAVDTETRAADEIFSEDVGNLTLKYTVTNGAARVLVMNDKR